MNSILLVTLDRELAEICQTISDENGWSLHVRRGVPSAAEPATRCDLLVVDVRVLPDSPLTFVSVCEVMLRRSSSLHAGRALALGNQEEMVGRQNTFVHGG